MISDDVGIQSRLLERVLVASIRFRAQTRAEIAPRFDRLIEACGDLICGPAMTIFHSGTVVPAGSHDVETVFPVSEPISGDGIQSGWLPAEKALTLLHRGPYDEISQTRRVIYDHMIETGLPASGRLREVYLEIYPDNPARSLTEVQVVLHPWEEYLADSLDHVLGSDVRQEIMTGREQIGPETGLDERYAWVKGTIERLEMVTDERQRFQVLSCCAHRHPPERVDILREVYEESGDIDKVLAVMGEDPEWYESPYRDGNIIYTNKIQGDVAGYQAAEDPAEKRMRACHCILIRQRLEAGMPATFCYCGSGWYRQLWEGVLGKPVHVELKHSLLQGDDRCQFAIHLPI